MSLTSFFSIIDFLYLKNSKYKSRNLQRLQAKKSEITLLEPRALLAATPPFLVADINPGAAFSSPINLTNVNGTLFFRANDGTNGTELWKINSTGGAEQVADINPNAASSNPRYLTNVNGTLFFQAFTGTNGYELWKINASGGAEQVADINPNAASSYPKNLTNVNGTLFFTTNNGANGRELWKINASGGAEQVADINPTGDSSPFNLTNVNGTLFFRANNGTNGYELWKINASGGAEQVADINLGASSSNPGSLTNVNGTLFFTAFTGTNGRELWKINASGGAEQVADINPTGNSSPSNLTNVNGTLFFSATNGTNGYELWKINASGGAEQVADINPTGNSFPSNLTNVNGTLFFRANNGTNGYELWKINASGGAEQVADINLGASSSNPGSLTNVNGTLFFSATNGTNGSELWKINSTGGAEQVADINPAGSSYPAYFTEVNGKVFFAAITADKGDEVWALDLIQFEVLDGVTSVPDNTGSVSFGTTTAGNAITKTFTINNIGSSVLNLNSVTVPAGFTLLTPQGVSVAPGNSTTIEVRLDATAVGAPGGTLIITTNDTDDSSYNFTISGTVNKATSTTSVNSTTNTSVFGQSVTFTATVTRSGAGIPTGTVQFKDGATNLGAPVILVAGSATLTTSALVTGSHSITAVYSGDANDLTSTSMALTQTVNKANTSTAITSSLNPSISGQSVTFTATVNATAPGAGIPTGTVQFKDGVVNLGTPVAVNASGVATLTTATLAVGSHTITAVYSGNVNFNTSTSNTLTQTVNPIAPEIDVLDDTMASILDNKGIISFGGRLQGSPLTKTFTIKNIGTGVLNVGLITVPAGFTVIQQPPSSINPGSSGIFKVRIDAISVGPFNGQLTFYNNDADENPFNFSINGTVYGPEIEVFDGNTSILDNTGIISFGGTLLGTPVSKTFTIKNIGNTVLNLGTVTVPTGFSVVTQPPASINAGGSATFVVKLDANTVGPFNGQLSFTNNDKDENPFNFFINGTVNGPKIEVSTDGVVINQNGVVTFGGPYVGNPKFKLFTIKNIGDIALKNIQISLPAGFTLHSSIPDSIAPNAIATIVVRLDALVDGPYNGLFSLKSGDFPAQVNTFSQFYINGRVYDTGLNVSQNGNSIVDNIGVFSFGTTILGTPVVKVFTIQNKTNVAVNLGNITVPTGFIVLLQPPATLAANSSATFTVRLEAAAAGNFSGDLSFTTSNPNVTTYNFRIEGLVTRPEIRVFQGTTELFDNYSVLSFGGTTRGTPVIKTFTIINTGNSVLNLGNLFLPNGFAVEIPPPSTVNPGASVTFKIKLLALVSGSYNGQFSLPTNDQSENPFNFYINGTVN